jgi:hypothetical protein
MSLTTITKENSIPILINAVNSGQRMGAYLLKDTKALQQAIDYFDPDVTEKPFSNSENPEVVAVNVLFQGIHKAQDRGGAHAYSIRDAALLYDILEFWVKEVGRAVTQNVRIPSSSQSSQSSSKGGSSPKSASAAKKKTISIANDDDDAEEEENDEETGTGEITPITYHSRKGKGV